MNYCKSKNWKFNISFTYASSSASFLPFLIHCPLCSDCSSLHPCFLDLKAISAALLQIWFFIHLDEQVTFWTLCSTLFWTARKLHWSACPATSSAQPYSVLDNITFNTSSPVEVIILYATAVSLLFICKCIHNIFRKPDPQSWGQGHWDLKSSKICGR